MSNRYGFINNGMANMGVQSSAANGIPTQVVDNPYLQQLKQKLEEAQKMQQQLTQLSANPLSQLSAMLPQQNTQPVTQAVAPPVQNSVSPEGQAVLALFEEFAKTEDGKMLVSYMGKFNSYCQSMIAKADGKS